MKIRVIKKNYDEVMDLPRLKYKKPRHQLSILRPILKVVCWVLLKMTGFTYEKIGMEKLGKKEPCLVLMNHSSFIDLEIVVQTKEFELETKLLDLIECMEQDFDLDLIVEIV